MPIVNRSFNAGGETHIIMVITLSYDVGNVNCYFFSSQIVPLLFGATSVEQRRTMAEHVSRRNKTAWKYLSSSVGNTCLIIDNNEQILKETGVLELFTTHQKKSKIPEFLTAWADFLDDLRDYTTMFKAWITTSYLIDFVDQGERKTFEDTYIDEFHILFAQTERMASSGIYFITCTTNFVQTVKNINKVSFEKYAIISAKPVRNGGEAMETVRKMFPKPKKPFGSSLLGRNFFMITPQQMVQLNEALDTLSPYKKYI